jgi:hypothetical protein
VAGSLFEETFECADEAGRVFVADCICDFFNAHIALQKKESSSVQALFDKASAKARAGLRFEQMLEMRGAQVKFEGQISDGAKRARFDYF